MIDVLRDEHELILRSLALIEIAADRAEVADTWWADVTAWLRAFADQAHHGKEEQELFPALVRAGVPNEGGPIGVMLAEHEQGRALVRSMAAERGAPRATASRRFVALLRDHIAKENDVLFPMAEAMLDDGTKRRLGDARERVAEELGPDASPVRAADRLAALAAALGAKTVSAA